MMILWLEWQYNILSTGHITDQILPLIDGVRWSSSRVDLKQWEPHRQGDYTDKCCSTIIDNIDFPCTFSFTPLLWKGLAPPRIEMFLWLLLQDSVCTRVFLTRAFNQFKPSSVSIL